LSTTGISVQTNESERRPLPKGWRWAKLKDVCRIVSGTTPKSQVREYWNGDIVWITPTDLGSNGTIYIGDSERRISQAGYDSCHTELTPSETVVMSSRAPIGHLAIAAVPFCTNQGCKSFVTGSDIDSRFLYFLLKSHVPEFRLLGGGATFAEISKTQLEQFEVALPSFSEQQRIATKLLHSFESIQRARAAAEAQLETANILLRRYMESAFHGITPLAVSGEHLPAPKGWRWISLTDVTRLESGHTPSRYHPEWWGGDIPWLALPDIRALDGKVALETTERTNPEGIAHSSARLLPTGTVCLSRTASVGFVTILGRPMATSQDFVDWVCGPELHSPFLAFLLRASREYIRSLSSGAIHKTVYMPTVKAFRVCIPKLDEQVRIANDLQQKQEATDSMLQALEVQKGTIESLPAALLRRAFNGEL